MVNILGSGLTLSEIVIILIFAFSIWVVVLAVREQDSNIPGIMYREYNNIFFEGTDINKGCSNFFDGLFSPSQTFKNDIGGLSFLINPIVGGANFLLTVLNFMFGAVILLGRILIGCAGGSIIRLAIGWSIIVYVLYKMISLTRDARDLIHR